MNQTTKYICILLAGAILGVFLDKFLLSSSDDQKNVSMDKPLYWVAPMDPEYRKDRPGKSPMGMDLIPVFDKSEGSSSVSPGTVTISPNVINNLGVRTAKVMEATLKAEIKTVGYVKYDEDKLKHIHPRVEGWIEKLYVKASGDPVQKDQPLYELYSPQLVNAQEEFLLALNRNNKSLIKAAESRLHALQLSKSFIKELKSKRSVKQTIVFNAPQDGVVDNLNIREGFFVNPGTTLMSIGILDEVWVEAEVFERQASLVKAGLPVTMSLDYLQGKSWKGQVDYVYPALDPKTRTARVRLRFKNEDLQLKPNMFAEVVIHSEGTEKTLMVPKEAVIRTGSQSRVVIALGDGKFKSIEVTIGRLDDKNVEVVKGLKRNDVVVVSAQFLLDSESSKTSDFKRMYRSDIKNVEVKIENHASTHENH